MKVNEIDLEDIQKQLANGKMIEEIIADFDWKKFEDIVAEIFERNDFKIKNNFRFKTRNRHQIDIIAIKQNKIFCVDCKQWGSGRYKKSGLKMAAKEQENRTKEFMRFLKKNEIAKSMLKIDLKNQNFYPLIVTLMQEDLIKENETFVIPVWKLNSFLLDREKYLT